MLWCEDGQSSGRRLIATIKFSVHITAKHSTHLDSACSLILKLEKYSHNSCLTSISLVSFDSRSTANCFFSSPISLTRACKTKQLVISLAKGARFTYHELKKIKIENKHMEAKNKIIACQKGLLYTDNFHKKN